MSNKHLKGREVRNILLSLAQDIRDDDDKHLGEWLDNVRGTIEGHYDGICWQLDMVKTLAVMVEKEPKTLKSLSAEIGDVTPAALGKIVRDYGVEQGLSIARNSSGSWQVAKAC
jgi:hypothetical protein